MNGNPLRIALSEAGIDYGTTDILLTTNTYSYFINLYTFSCIIYTTLVEI